MEFLQSQYLHLPQEPGVYLFEDRNNQIIYVGKAKDLKKRVASYFAKEEGLSYKKPLLVAKIEKIKVVIVESEIESLLLEANLIKKYNPLFNVKLTDGKAYPLIRITKKDNYPKVLIARRSENRQSLYFGPYPNVSAMKLVLKTVRKIFPFQSIVNHPKRICLYNHLGLCPCPPVFDSVEFKKQYRKDINHIIKFLQGNIKGVLQDLEKERDGESKIENFEQAKKIQEKINAIKIITSKVRSPFEYEQNSELLKEIRTKEAGELLNALQSQGVQVSNLTKIECYDISNISGKHATGSMVVFINGEKEPSLYRRFKIRFSNDKPDDFLMMEQVLVRRLKHKEWSYPDLIIVDGGKGQVSSALKAIKRSYLSIPVVGLAKREEKIIVVSRCKQSFEEICLPKSSKALHLMQRIRDEAHRFAITYHRHLRYRFLLN